MHIIKENQVLILSLKGIEQYHYHKDTLDTAQVWLIEVINSESDFVKVLKAMISHKVDRTNLDFLIDNHYVSIVEEDKLDDEKQIIHEQFLMQQTMSCDINELGGNKFDAFDFIRGEKKIDNYMDKIDPSDITIMPNKLGNDSLYSTGGSHQGASGSAEATGPAGGRRTVSTKTPEVKAFEEIKEVLKTAIRDTFSIKAYVYNYQLSKIENITELNSFFNKLFPQIQKQKGEEYCDELVSKVKIISANYGI